MSADVGSVEWLVACEQIRQLASRYAVAMNHRDLDTLVGLFVPDVRVGHSGAGRAALREDFARQLRPLGRSILQVTNQVIDVVDGTHAKGVVGTHAEVELVDGGAATWIVQVIEYHDTYAIHGDRWLFVRRKHHLWYGAPIGTTPIGLPPANWPAHPIGEGDLPEALPDWQRWKTRT
jgi:hypothetical protein